MAAMTTYADRTTTALGSPALWVVGIGTVGLALAFGAPTVLVGLLCLVALAGLAAVSPGDATTVLSTLVLTLFAIPQSYIIEPLGAAGTPAILIGIGALAWWAVARTGALRGFAKGYQPIRIGVAILLLALLASIAAGWFRPLDGLEARNSDRTILTWLGYLGALLLAADGITDRFRLDVLLRRITWGGSYMSVVAMGQWFVNVDIARIIAPPGLTFNALQEDTTALFARGDFIRVTGTAMHPIEFSVVGAAILPIAVAYAFNDTHRPLLARWTPVVLCGFAMPMAISRSGFLGVAIVAAILAPALPATRRMMLGGVGIASAGAMTVVVPGLLGTIRDWFLAAGSDSSVESRTSDYQYLNDFVDQRPWFGRGFGTFEPSLYDFLDNQYLLTLIEGGMVGVVALIVLLVSAMGTAAVVRRRVAHDGTRLLAQALLASVAVHAGTFALYDALVFPTTGLSLFLTIGCIGALWRLTSQEHHAVARRSQLNSLSPEAPTMGG